MNRERARRQKRFLQKARAKGRARVRAEQTWGIWGNYFRFDTPRDASVAVGRLAATPQLCSCSWCGNPRRQLGQLTRQEIRAEDADGELAMYERERCGHWTLE